MDTRKRSTLLTLGVIVVGYAALRGIPSLLPRRLEFEQLESPPGFRKYVAGDSSSGFDLFVGLGAPRDAEAIARKEAAVARVSGDICGALYGGSKDRTNRVPIASFSDYYCPFCRVQTRRLLSLAAEMPNEVAIVWHEYPLLGDGSDVAARAALAAKRQGAYIAFHERLMATPFKASPAYLSRLADDLGVDKEQLLSDMESAAVALELEDSLALARVFAFVGTPALVIGRTVVQGQVSDKTIRQIIDLEREEGWEAVCAPA